MAWAHHRRGVDAGRCADNPRRRVRGAAWPRQRM